MSWNPLEFSYKVYPESGRATFVSHMCSYTERLLVIMGIICAVFGLLPGIATGAVMLGIAYLLHIKKEGWCENIIKNEFSKHATNTRSTNRANQSETIVHTNTNPKSSFVGQNPPSGNSSKTSNKFCTECGTPNPRSAKFCQNRGHQF